MSKQRSVRSAKVQSMDPGFLGPLVEAFTDHLFGFGHAKLTVQGYRDSARHFADWLWRSNIELDAISDDVIVQFSNHRCRCPGTRRSDQLSEKYINRVRRFIRFLATSGVIPEMASGKPTAISPQVAEFQDWLRRHRGISERTIDRHGRMMTRLLPTLGDDSARYNASLIRRVIFDEAQRNTPVHTKTMTTALRSYLRFLGARGACQPWLYQAVPTIPQWRLSTLPRYLPAADVEKLITSCDLTQAHGIRDRAILLLLARLGLRAGDVLDMRLDDIAWAEGALRVRGKGWKEICLPLPQDAGDALLDYLHRARPSINDSRIFLRSVAPYRPFADSTAISHVVQRALSRAAIIDPPSRGAHLLRHSAATTMLRQGASLDTVGTILRHHSADTTAHYAKVDIAMLREDVTRYVDLHRALGFKFRSQEGLLRNFMAFAEAYGDDVVLARRVLEWAAQAPSPPQRRNRLHNVRRFALAMQVEDSRYEIPAADALGRGWFQRCTPYIYSLDVLIGVE